QHEDASDGLMARPAPAQHEEGRRENDQDGEDLEDDRHELHLNSSSTRMLIELSTDCPFAFEYSVYTMCVGNSAQRAFVSPIWSINSEAWAIRFCRRRMRSSSSRRMTRRPLCASVRAMPVVSRV